GAVDEDDCGDHPGLPCWCVGGANLAMLSARTVRLPPARTASTRCSSGPTYPAGQTTPWVTRPSTVAPAPTTARTSRPVTVARGSTRLSPPAAYTLAPP